MAFALSKRSLNRLEFVHPDLVKVVKRAIEVSRIDFGVSEGVRTVARQKELLAQGLTTTMKSKHLVQGTGYSHAVDLVAYIDGKVTWEHKQFRLVIQAMMTAAIELRVPIKAGGLWRDFLDSPHFELDSNYY